MKSVVTVSNALIAAILDGAPISEPDQLRLMAEVGLSWPAVRDFTARTSIVRLARLWTKLVALTGDDFVGLHIGRTVPVDRFGLAVHVALNSDDFRQVLTRFAKYAGLINDLLECRLEETADQARFITRLHWDVLGLERHAVDITLAAVLTWGRARLGPAFEVHAVRVRHTLEAGRGEYERVFGAPVELGARANELVFGAAALAAVIPSSNRDLGLILDHYASTEVARIPILTDLPARVSQIVRRELEHDRRVELAAVADELKMSTRHLQRQLSEASTSFTLLLDDIRKALAPTLLVQPSANVEQVGFQLGYSEPTAFIRAFKKWYGMTPGTYRRQRT